MQKKVYLDGGLLQYYIELGISPRDFENPKRLVGFEGLIRFLNETIPGTLSATSEDIREQLPSDLPKLMEINKFHFESAYNKELPPTKQETYQLIAKILVTKDIALWRPTLNPNNHWSNWESGHL